MSHNIRTLQGGSQTQQAASQADVAELRRIIDDQRRQIAVLNSSLEQLVINYRNLATEINEARQREVQAGNRITRVENVQSTMQTTIRAVQSEQAQTIRRLDEVDTKAEISYQNSTADDQAREFMYNERYMIGDDTPLSEDEFREKVDHANSGRKGRRHANH